MDDKYEDLANAIVITAVKDYRDVLKKLKKHPNSNYLQHTKNEIERFFHSKWYSVLTDIGPEFLIKKLNEEVI
ncbi:hypothetical protein EQM13_16190 [Acidilutibacter cellobiosedens]|uniref:Uncharacterized protein n=1 Tax=Acidilutibacter cellobiosedens TaxID=2507161 RepID=A0A410QFW7_9FIRM|nr:hypothetical protein [Acidilutibacter cellobiosedens]QAT62992.1 hypothetical protein EQM13_16190 [Acidilutibacter cellobiosedens]